MKRKTKTLHKYINRTFGKASDEINFYLQYGEKESIHQLRVELKKIFSFFKVLRFTGKDFSYKKNKNKFRKIYELAGRIRENSLISSTILEHSIGYKLSGSLDELNKETECNHELFIQHAWGSVRKLKKEPGRLKILLKKLKAGDIKKYIKFNLVELDKLSEPNDFNQLHDVRKRIKRILHAENFLKHLSSSSFLTKTGRRLLDIQQEIIGQWHDKVLMFIFLKENYLIKEEQLAVIETALKKESKNLWNRTKQKSTDLMKQLGYK